jgi:hypothetical protein
MFKWIPRLGHRMVDWFEENILGISSPTDLAKIPPDKLQEIRLRIHGVDPVTRRTLPKAGSAGGCDGPSNASGIT